MTKYTGKLSNYLIQARAAEEMLMTAEMNRLMAILINRDHCTVDEARRQVKEARERVAEGEDPEEILYEDFGLEPDYIDDLI